MAAPKREKLREAQAELEEAQGQLEEKQSQLREIQARVAALQRKYDNSMKEKEDLTAQIGLTEKRLERASRLMQLLSGERVRWAEESERLKSTRSNVIGDALLSAGGVAYLGLWFLELPADRVSMARMDITKAFVVSLDSF